MFGSLVSTVGFIAWQDARASTAPSVVLHALLGGQMTAYPRWATLERSLQLAFSAYISSAGQPLYWIWNVLIYGSAGGLLLNRGGDRNRALQALAVGTLAAAIALALGFSLLNYFEGHFNYYTPARYFLPLLPILGYLVAKSLRPVPLVFLGVALPGLATISAIFGHPF